MKIFDDITQGEEAWFRVRLGMVTASNFAAVCAKGQGKTRKSYMMKLASEQLTGEPEPTYKSDYMEHGSETEDLARHCYEQIMDCNVRQVGFIQLSDYVGCSPDGLVGDPGMLEIKCPKSTTHVETLERGSMQTCYRKQVQGQLWVAGRQWCDWVSYDPRVLEWPMFKERVFRDEELIATIKEEVYRFVAELKEMVANIRERAYAV